MNIPAIIAKYLKELSYGKWKKFKVALCNTKPPGKAKQITMDNLKNKSKEQVVELIFKCHKEKPGTQIIKKILTDLKEYNLCRRMQRRLCDTSKRMTSKDVPTNDDTVSSSEPPAKKIRQEDGEVPGPSHNTEQNVHKKRRPSSSQEEPKQEIPNLQEIVKNPLELFKEVEARPALYNRNNPDNTNQEVKKKLWEEVARKVVKVYKQLDAKAKEETIKLLCKKWRNLADTFRREYNRKNTNYRYYKQLKFLECRMEQRQEEKKNQAAANKTKKSEQVLQTVSEVSSQGTSQNVKKNNKKGGPAPKQGTSQNIENYFCKGGAAPKQGSSQSEKLLPSITVEEFKKIMVTCLKAQSEDRKNKFQNALCELKPPENGEIELEELKDKSEEDVADMIISRHTMKHVKNTFIKCLEKIKDNQAKEEFTEKIRELEEQKKKASKK